MKQLILVLLMGVFTSLTAQDKGIQFLNDTVFENVLAKAKAENKLIFIDCYAVWCGPCKFMDANIFPDEKLGEFHNTNFINIKYDMEKPYGMKIRKQYGVKAFPTFLYLNADGEVLHRFVGATMKPEDFLKISKLATDMENNFKAVSQRISQGDRRASTISDYLSMNYGATNADTLITEHFNLISDKEKLSTTTWKMLTKHLKTINNPAFTFFIKERQTLEGLYGKKDVDDLLLGIMTETYRKSPQEIGRASCRARV